MAKYRTMTPEGGYGSDFEAESWEDAERQAKAAGYNVVDWIDHGGENVLVILDD